MPSSVRPLQFRLPWLRNLLGQGADQFTKQIMNHPEVRSRVEEGRCPICGELFDDCEYFKRLEEE